MFEESIERMGPAEIEMRPEKRIDVIISTIFPDAMIRAEEGYDCANYAEKKIERNYTKAKNKLIPVLEKIDSKKAEFYSKMLDESYFHYKSMINDKKNIHLKSDTESKTRLESGEFLHYNKPIEIIGKSGTPYKFDGRTYGVVFRNYNSIANQDDVKMLYEISNDCLEDVLMRAVMLTPEAEALAEKLGVLVEYHTPECMDRE